MQTSAKLQGGLPHPPLRRPRAFRRVAHRATIGFAIRRPCGALGRSLAALGRSLAALGQLLGGFWALLERFLHKFWSKFANVNDFGGSLGDIDAIFE